jgi:uncharacterized membrane protein
VKSEPVRYISIAVAIVLAALPHLQAFGVPVTQHQVDALNTFLPSVLVLLGGELMRARVSPAGQS